ncbi:RHS repeat-associated core domain-containing protein, partial [Candidatus Woesearchaeota archaeon]|nr:RHS repeat-associated core domain-containing protein [Candidatus Woesearchaeota archaeon]
TMSRASQTYYYFHDGLGSVTDLAKSTGELVESYSYDVYGAPSSSSTVGNPYLFTGREYDQETGLYYYRARYYAPSIGRFLQRDPLKYLPDINFYRYVYNNPTNWIDPLGLEAKNPLRAPRVMSGLSDMTPFLERIDDLLFPSAFAGEPGEPTARKPIFKGTEKYSVGYGLRDEILIAGGAGLAVVGVGLKSPLLTFIGGGLALFGVYSKIEGIIRLPETAQKTAERIYEQTGLKEHYEEIDRIGVELDKTLRR